VLVTTKEAAREHVYLADFGLTRRGATGHRTRTGDFLGSPTYAAPEHLRGEPLDGRTDQYALACMLFACLSGRPPFQGGVQDVIQGHLAAEIPALSSLVSVPPGIDDVLRKGTAKDPNQRFGSCQELIAAARAALAGAQPGTPPARRPDPAQSGPLPTATHTGGVPVQQYAGPRPGYQQPGFPAEPVRLRPPAPVGSSAFTDTKQPRPAWFAPVVVGAVAIALVVVLVVILSPKDEPPRNQNAPTTSGQSIKVGEDSGSRKPLPTSVPVRTPR
jgi:serine/threonine protein kinase